MMQRICIIAPAVKLGVVANMLRVQVGSVQSVVVPRSTKSQRDKRTVEVGSERSWVLQPCDHTPANGGLLGGEVL